MTLSCNPVHYEGDATGFAKHCVEVHGLKMPDELLNAWSQSQWCSIDAIHKAASNVYPLPSDDEDMQ